MTISPAVQAKRDSVAVRDLDEGWAWVVLAASGFIFAIILGQSFTFNIYFVVFLNEFGQSRSTTAWVGSLHFAVNQTAAIFIGFFLRKLGTRGCTMSGGLLSAIGFLANSFATELPHLMISYGVLVALGTCLCIFSSLDAVSQYFNRYLYPATGICMAGGGIGLMLFGFITQWLLDTFGWRGSMMMMAGFSLQICVLGALFFPRPPYYTVTSNRATSSKTEILTKEASAINQDIEPAEKPKAAPPSEQLMTWKQRFADPRVSLLAIAGFLQGIGALTMFVIYKDLAIFNDLEKYFSWTLLAIGVGSLSGRLLTGVLTKFLAPILLFAFVTAMCAAVVLSNIFTSRPEVFITLAALFGYCQGSMASSMPVVIAYMFGRHQIATMFGYMMFYAGIGTLVGSPLAGYITDVTGIYDGCLGLSGAFLAASAVLVIILNCVHSKKQKRERTRSITMDLAEEVHQLFEQERFTDPSKLAFMRSTESICQKPM